MNIKVDAKSGIANHCSPDVVRNAVINFDKLFAFCLCRCSGNDILQMLEDEQNPKPSTSLSSGASTAQQKLSWEKNETAAAPPADALRVLRKYFGHNSFRPLQWAVIQNALNGKDQVVVMSTGIFPSH